MKKIVYVLSVISLVLVVACSAISAKEKDKAIEPEVFEITNTIVDNIHYNRQELNDDFSKKVFDVFIENIDPNKRFLFQKDIQQLSKSKFKLDDAVKEKDLSGWKPEYQTFAPNNLNMPSIYN